MSTIKKANTRKKATAGPSYPREVKVCSTRFMDSKTGRWTSPPKGPAPLKAVVQDTRRAAGDRAVIVVTERDASGESRVKSVKVRDLAGRTAAAGLRTKKERRQAVKSISRGERDAELLELERRGGKVSAYDHAASMAAELRADQTRRGQVSRKRNAAARAASPKKGPNPDELRARLLATERAEQEARSKAQRAKTDKTRTAHTRRARSAADRAATLRGQLARLGVRA